MRPTLDIGSHSNAGAERRAASSGSDVGADAVSRRLRAVVETVEKPKISARKSLIAKGVIFGEIQKLDFFDSLVRCELGLWDTAFFASDTDFSAG